MSGKGSRRRPAFIPIQDFGENWAKIFEKPKQEKESDDNSTNGKADRPDAAGDSATETNGRDTL
jgi:hypothetical protein